MLPIPTLPVNVQLPTVAPADAATEGSWAAVALSGGLLVVAILAVVGVDAGIVGAAGVFVTAFVRWVGLHLLPH